MSENDIPEADELITVILDLFAAVNAGQPSDEQAMYQLLADSAAQMILLSSQVKVAQLLNDVREIEIKRLKGK